MIISFAWTTDAFKAGRKDRTRRYWTEKYAKIFLDRIDKKRIHDAYDRQPRFGGKRIGLLIVTSMKKEHMSKMPDEDYEREGFKFMEENNIKIWGKHPRDAFDDWRKEDGTPWVIDFERV